ncbi:hypothetical protein GCM10027578_05540 [Spirosoma luteolum]
MHKITTGQLRQGNLGELFAVLEAELVAQGLAHTWAPCGPTPVLIEQAGRAHLSLIAAVAPNGRLYIVGQDQPFCSEDIVWFLGKLCHRYRKRDLLVVWDGAAIHRSQVVKAQLSSKLRRLHLERLPAYNPEINPVELLWSDLKQSLKNQAFTTLEQLQAAVLNQIERLHSDPKLIT